jgi:hypothetical protein
LRIACERGYGGQDAVRSSSGSIQLAPIKIHLTRPIPELLPEHFVPLPVEFDTVYQIGGEGRRPKDFLQGSVSHVIVKNHTLPFDPIIAQILGIKVNDTGVIGVIQVTEGKEIPYAIRLWLAELIQKVQGKNLRPQRSCILA